MIGEIGQAKSDATQEAVPMWLAVPIENDVHVLPVGELHELDRGCHCLPVLESCPRGLLILHGRLEEPS